MNEPCRVGRERRLFHAGCFLFLALLFGWPSAALAGFTIWPPPAEQPLDGQTTDWINITSNALGAGVGTLYGGVVNVGVDGLSLLGDLSINNGGLLDANRVDSNGQQYSGTINVGPRLEMTNGGRLVLNKDNLNILGYPSQSWDGTFNVYTGSAVTAADSSILGAAIVRITGSGSSLGLLGSTFGFRDELWVADGAVLNDIGSFIAQDSSTGRSSLNRGDIIIVNGAAVDLDGTRVDITGGTSGWLKIETSSLSANASQLSTHWIDSNGSTLTYDSSSVVSRDSIWHSDSTISQIGGETVFADELVLRAGAAMSVQGTAADPALVRHQAVAGEVDNRGSLWLDDAILALTNANFDITSGVNGEIQVREGSLLTATDSTLANKTTIVETGGQMGLTRSQLQTGYVAVNNGSDLSLEASTVDTGASDGMEIQGASTLSATNGSQLQIGGQLLVQDGSQVRLEQTTVDADSVWVEHTGSQVEMTGGSLNAWTNIGIGNYESPTGSLVLNGTTVTTSDMSVLGRLLAMGSAIDAGDRFGGYGQNGTAASVSLTDSSLAATWIDFGQSQHSYQKSTLSSHDSIWYSDSTISQTGGQTVFADQLFLLNGTSMTVQGTESAHAVLRHQAIASEPDNRGELIVDNSTLALTYADVNLSSGGSGLMHVHDNGQLTAVDSTLANKTTIVETGGQMELTRAQLQTGYVAVNQGSALSLEASTVDTGASEWMKIQSASTLSATNGSQLQIGGQLLVQDGSQVRLEQTTVDADSVWIEHTGSQVEMTGGSLNARTNIGIGNYGSPTGSLVLDGTTVTTSDMSVLGRLLAMGSAIDAGDRFGGYGQNGTAASVSLTDSSLAATWIDFGQSQHSYQNSTLSSHDSIWYSDSTISQAGGQTVFADELVLRAGAAMSVQGTAAEHALVRHQAAAGEIDNRGSLWLDDASLALQDVDLVLDGGVAGEIQVNIGSQLTAVDSNLTANSLHVDGTSTFSATDSIIDILGNTTTIDAGGSMVLNGGVYTEAGDLLVNGSLGGTAPVIRVGSDFLLSDTAALAFSGPAEIFVGDDFVNELGSGLDPVIVHMLGTSDDDAPGDDYAGFVFDSLASIGKLIVETSLTLLGDLLVDQLVIGTGWEIDLNGHSLTISERFDGRYDQIFGGDVFGPAAVPEPSTLVLFSGGLLGLAWCWRRK